MKNTTQIIDTLEDALRSLFNDVCISMIDTGQSPDQWDGTTKNKCLAAFDALEAYRAGSMLPVFLAKVYVVIFKKSKELLRVCKTEENAYYQMEHYAADNGMHLSDFDVLEKELYF